MDLDIYRTKRYRNSFILYIKSEICLLSNGFYQVINKHGLHSVSTDDGTWYIQACRFLNLGHHIHPSFEQSLIERTMRYIKDRTENFDDYFPCKKNKCKLNHIKQWLKLFVYQHNKEIIS